MTAALLFGLVYADRTRAVVIRYSADQSVCRLADAPGFCGLYILIPDYLISTDLDHPCVYTESLYWTYDIHLTTHTESIGLMTLIFISDISGL